MEQIPKKKLAMRPTSGSNGIKVPDTLENRKSSLSNLITPPGGIGIKKTPLKIGESVLQNRRRGNSLNKERPNSGQKLKSLNPSITSQNTLSKNGSNANLSTTTTAMSSSNLSIKNSSNSSNSSRLSALTVQTNNSIIKQQKSKTVIVDKEASKQFEKDYNQVLNELRSFQGDKSLAEQQDEVIKELCGRLNVLMADWDRQPDLTQKLCCRESLLQALILIVKDIENPKVRIRSIKQSINIFKSIGFNYICSDKELQDLLLPPEALFQLLQAVLKQALKLTKNSQLEEILIEENMTGSYLDLLQSIRQAVNPKSPNQKTIDLLIFLYGIMKNETSNEKVRKKYYQPQNLTLVVSFLHIFEFDASKEGDQKKQEKIFELYIAVTALIRNLAIDVNCTVAYWKYKVIERLTKSIELYPNVNDLMLNTVRILSKVSLNRECSMQIFENQYFIKNILGFFKTYKQNLFIIIRVSFILANLTTFIKDIRTFIYFKQNGFKDIYSCFDYYTGRELGAKNKNNEIDQMNITNTGWDFKQMQKESDMEAMIKIIRLIANLLTIEEIGNDLIQNKNMYYKDLIKKLRIICSNKDINSQGELISCCLSCLANLTFYERQALPTADFEFKNAKIELIVTLGGYIMQTDNEDICCEALRVISNLSRHKDLVKNMVKYKIVEGIIVLLDSNSKDVVYYALGVLINLMKVDDIKTMFGPMAIESVIQILEDCTMDENDLISLGLKCTGNLIDSKTMVDNGYLKRIENILDNMGVECDTIIEQSQDLSQSQQISEIYDIRAIINQLLNNMPEESYECPAPNCGRKFKEQLELQSHIKRRHNL